MKRKTASTSRDGDVPFEPSHLCLMRSQYGYHFRDQIYFPRKGRQASRSTAPLSSKGRRFLFRLLRGGKKERWKRCLGSQQRLLLRVAQPRVFVHREGGSSRSRRHTSVSSLAAPIATPRPRGLEHSTLAQQKRPLSLRMLQIPSSRSQ